MGTKGEQPRAAKRRRTDAVADGEGRTVALRIAQEMGLLSGPKTKHFDDADWQHVAGGRDQRRARVACNGG